MCLHGSCGSRNFEGDVKMVAMEDPFWLFLVEVVQNCMVDRKPVVSQCI